MPGPWLKDDDIRNSLAAVLNEKDGAEALAAFWDRIIPSAHRAGYNEIVAKLVARGYTVAQLDTWDRRQEYEEDISLWWCLVKGESEREGAERGMRATQVPKLLFQLDRRKELDDPNFTLTSGDVPLTPAGVGDIASGPLSTEHDYFPPPRRPFRLRGERRFGRPSWGGW